MLLMLSACSNHQIQYVTKTERVIITPEDAQKPHCDDTLEADRLTAGGATDLVVALRAEIQKCNTMSDNLWEWFDTEKAR